MHPPNILVVVVDTLRADHLGCYGYHRETSPAIDEFAGQGVLCDNFYAPAIPTHPAFTTLFTGQFSITHQIVSHGGEKELAGDAPWLPQLLLRAGYTTCALDNLASAKTWFGRGWEFYIDPSHHLPARLSVDCEMLNRRALEWLRAHRNERFFLFLHYWDPHTHYTPPKRCWQPFYDSGRDPCDPHNHSLDALDHQPLGDLWREIWFRRYASHPITDAEFIIALYDGAIRYVDEAIGQLLQTLDHLGLTENTLLLITADHGESLTEHDIYFEHHGLYECTIRVPLIVRHPNGGISGGKRLAPLMQENDLAPTILECAGLPVHKRMEGRSLLRHWRGEASGALHEQLIAQECTWQAKWAIRKGDHKLILAREPDFHNAPMRELYNLAADPAELHNLADERRELAQVLEAELEGWIARMQRKNGLAADPLREQGITLGRRWREGRRG